MLTDSWFKCYGQAWGNLCTPAAVAHPAKFSRKLIFRIFEHAIEEGWVKPGDTCLDVFGGVALGGLPAMLNGLHWVGVELEARFCALAQDNIDLWNKQYSTQMPNWGTAVIVQGDSRRLGEVLARARCCISSPPYAGSLGDGKSGIDWGKQADRETAHPHGWDGEGYGSKDGQLAAMPDTGFEAALAVSSPAWMGSGMGGKDNVVNLNRQCVSHNRPENIGRGETARGLTYGSEPGQLAQMPEGDLAAVISSPPFQGSLSRDNVTEGRVALAREKGISVHLVSPVDMEKIGKRTQGYNAAGGQLGAMPSGDHAAALEAEAETAGPIYRYAWKNNSKRKTLYNRLCRVVARLAKNSAIVEFEDGQRECVSRNALRRADAETVKAELCLSSPPYSHVAKGLTAGEIDRKMQSVNLARRQRGEIKGGVGRSGRLGASILAPDGYGTTVGQLGQETGTTFWAASKQILEQVYEVLAPGAHAIWVLKMFVRNKQLVDFPGQWEALCQSVGFRTVCKHRAWLNKNAGIVQTTLDGEEMSMEKWFKGFFRRLCESKGSPRIDWESILCMVKE